MGRFAVFAGKLCYPIGGWSDLYGIYETDEEARWSVAKHTGRYGWAHYIDLDDPRFVAGFRPEDD